MLKEVARVVFFKVVCAGMYVENLRKFIKYFGRNKKKGLIGFAVLSFFSGCLELLGVALVYPFIMLIVDPSAVSLIKIVHIEHIPSGKWFPFVLGGIVFLAFISKNTLMIFIQYLQSRFVSRWRVQIVDTLMNYFLFAPYKDTMKYSKADKLYLIESVVSVVISDFVVRSLNLLTNSLIILMIISLLVVKFPIPAVLSSIIVCISLGVQNKFFKKRTSELSRIVTQKSREYKGLLVQNIYNIKELKILTAEEFFNQKFRDKQNELVNLQIKQGFYGSIPPYIIETLIILGLLTMAVVLSFQKSGDGLTLLASFGVIVAALFRIAPALNRVQTSIINISMARNFVKLLNGKYEEFGLETFEQNVRKTDRRMEFKQSIRLEGVSFSYDDKKLALKNVNLEINRGDFVGIIGLSGAGKSTLADVITGILPVNGGNIYVDGVRLTNENFPEFRKIIGYVPQQINMTEQSFKENVAWGCETIDENRVRDVLKLAQLYETICETPDGIDTVSKGETGLSQGQKQRLALARALYRAPELIILDEATSALDVQVEHEITEMLSKVSEQKTIIAIAHRLSTLKACNKLVYVKDGEIVDVGTFVELSDKYPEFYNLVKLSTVGVK